jgi:iron(III) transport system substrate-binding protein
MRFEKQLASPAWRNQFIRFCGAVSLGAALVAPATSVAQTRNTQAELDALIKAVRAENGELTMYVGYTENVARRVTAAFNAKYGLKAQFIRMDAGPLAARYSGEAQSGNIGADLVITAGGADRLAETGVKSGWFEPIGESGIPVILSGEYPARYNRGRSAIVQITPWILAYNTEKVKGADVPKDWADLANPKWRGQVIVSDPGISDSYAEFWSLILDKYGEGFFEKLRPNLRRVLAPVPAAQGLGAGEAAFNPPVVSGLTNGLKERGAPVETVMPDVTTGVLLQIMLTARAKAKNPAAARLFANYVLSPEGSKVVADDPGQFSLYDSGKLPKGYEPPKPMTPARRDETRKALGYM